MPSKSDERTLPKPAGRQLLVNVSFMYPREKWQILRAAAAKRDQSIAELCRKAVERYLADPPYEQTPNSRAAGDPNSA